MPKVYNLKINHLSKENLNRLIKTTIDNCKEDRLECLELYKDIKSRLPSAETDAAYSDLVKNATSVLKQVQDVNSVVIKTMGIIQDHLSKNTPSSSRKSDSAPIDLFEGLSKLTRSEDDSKKEAESR